MTATIGSARTTKRVRRKSERRKDEPLADADAPETEQKNLSQRWRTGFLAKLAETSNVRSACEHAGISPTTVYELRRKDQGFAGKWMEALCEVYDNLEMEMLHRLRTGDRKDADAAKFNYVIAFRMLHIHRESVTRERARRANVNAAAVRASIDRKVAEMRALVLADQIVAERDAEARSTGANDGT